MVGATSHQPSSASDCADQIFTPNRFLRPGPSVTSGVASSFKRIWETYVLWGWGSHNHGALQA